ASLANTPSANVSTTVEYFSMPHDASRPNSPMSAPAQPSSATDLSLIELHRFRLLINAISDYAIYMLSPDGTIVSWNEGARRLKGYETQEIIGQHFSRFYGADDLETGMPARALHLAETTDKFEG